MLKKLKITLLLFGAVLLLSQCSDDDSSENPSTPSQTEEGIQFKINDGAWIKLPGTALKVADDQYTVSALIGGSNKDYISIAWRSGQAAGTFNWDFISQGPEDGNFFHYKPDGVGKHYQSFYVVDDTAFDSPGSLQITKFENVGGYVTGTFVIEKATQLDASSPEHSVSTVKIEGKFKVKRAE